MRAHLLKIPGQGLGVCQKVTVEDLVELRKLDAEAEKLKEQAIPKKVPLPPSSVINYHKFDSKKRKTFSGPLEKDLIWD